MNSSALAGLTFSAVGAGRVGASLATWATAAGARLTRVAGRDAGETAAALTRRLGGQAVALDALETGGDDFLIVAVPDPALDEVALRLSGHRQAHVVWHTSGARDASALAALRPRGSEVGSLHPLHAFPALQPLPEPATFFAIDGDPRALALARRAVAAWDGTCAEVPADCRRLYHLGAWLSAGGVATLAAAAGALARRLGLPDAVAAGYRHLALGAVAALEGTDPAARITGPVARGDAALVLGQIEELERAAPELVALVREVGLQTLREIDRSRGLDERQNTLREALGGRLIP